ncbi:hypothetical protein [Nocardia jiangxiensis]|uniref:Transposase n=1 Tax=Nocardia jiangxiensis TaxID=282685 RepID=A0ABW6SCB4_9NOCA|nr:hypothetical protein [Nocardia jiangxiensis]
MSAAHLVGVATYDSHDEIELFCTEHHFSMPCLGLRSALRHLGLQFRYPHRQPPNQPASPIILPTFLDTALAATARVNAFAITFADRWPYIQTY